MNFPNPYFYSIPASSSSLLSKFNLTSIISGTSKTLNLVNQAIPIVKQVSPIIKNAKTMFTVMNEFKKSEPIKSTTSQKDNNSKENPQVDNPNSNFPTFFI